MVVVSFRIVAMANVLQDQVREPCEHGRLLVIPRLDITLSFDKA